MADHLTAEQRSFNMSRIRGRDTKPEMVVRRMLHALGFRFRLHRADLPGKPDIVLSKWRTVVFVHGCFWHGDHCDLFRWPATRQEFWRAKIESNVTRDHAAIEKLLAAGWRVVTVWECALKGKKRLDSETLAQTLESAARSSEGLLEIRGV